MKSKTITELVTMHMKPEFSDALIIKTFQDLESNFHRHLSGFLNSELSKGENDQWLLLMHWESREKLNAASKEMMQSHKTETFRSMLDPKTVNIRIYNYLESWTKQE